MADSVPLCRALGLSSLAPGAPVQPPAGAHGSGRLDGAVRPAAGRGVVADGETPLCQSRCTVWAGAYGLWRLLGALSSGSTAGCQLAVVASGRRGMWLLWALSALTFPAVSEALPDIPGSLWSSGCGAQPGTIMSWAPLHWVGRSLFFPYKLLAFGLPQGVSCSWASLGSCWR